MSLRRRTLLIVCLLMLVTWGSVQLVERWLIYPRFVTLEKEQAQLNAERVIEFINRELALLVPICENWSYWDDSYRFARELDTTFARVNLTEANQHSLGVNLLAYYDNNGRKLWSRGYDFATRMSFPLDEFAKDKLPADYPLLAREDVPTVRVGLLNTSRGPMLAVGTPVLRSARIGPRRGTLIMGRFLDAEAVQRIAQQTLQRIELRQTRNGQAVIAHADPTSRRIAHTDFVFRTGRDAIEASASLAGMNGRPLLDLSIEIPRDVTAQGRRALRLSMLSVGLAGLLITLILLWLLDANIVVPLARFTQLARKIGADDNNAARLKLDRSDEIGELGREFDRMLDRLADARQRLLNESYRTGANEMAGGVIRDVRESLFPLKTHIDRPLRLLDSAQTSGIQMLLHELAAPGTSSHRQMEISTLLQDQISEQANYLAEARGELRGIRKSLEHLQSVVTEYSRYINSSSSLTPVAMHELVDYTLRHLPAAQYQAIEVQVDEHLYLAPKVEAVREILQQVVNVLIAQSAQADPSASSPGRLLRISANPEFVNGKPMLHVRFSDNRPSPGPATLAVLFGREWKVGEDTQGLSLPWAENAVTSMGGQLYAEPSGPPGGLALHLLLPRASTIDE